MFLMIEGFWRFLIQIIRGRDMKKGYLSPYTKQRVLWIMSKYFGISQMIAEQELNRLLVSYDNQFIVGLIIDWDVNLKAHKKGDLITELVAYYPFYQKNPEFIPEYVKQLRGF